jgi:recombinational DNA repair ATPase RecF
LLECAIALAQFSSDYHSTILVLDDGLHGLDQEWRQNYLLRLNAVDCRFQTVITDVGAMKDIAWGGWQYVNF